MVNSRWMNTLLLAVCFVVAILLGAGATLTWASASGNILLKTAFLLSFGALFAYLVRSIRRFRRISQRRPEENLAEWIKSQSPRLPVITSVEQKTPLTDTTPGDSNHGEKSPPAAPAKN